MKTVLLLVALSAVTTGQSASSVAGTWTAQFEGRTFIRLELSAANGAVKGGIALANIEFDKTGAVGRVASDLPPDLKPISNVMQRESVTTFAVASTDDVDAFELRVTGPGRAELVFLINDEQREELAEMGIPAPRPVPLTRR